MDTVARASTLARVVVSSDDERVLELAAGRADMVPLRRPDALATDTSPAVDYVLHALDEMERSRGEAPFDAVCIVQPSSPLTLPEDVDGTVRLLIDSGADTAVSVVKLDHAVHPAKLKVMDGDRLLPYLEDEAGRMASHELPDVYVRNCSVYVSRRTVFTEHRQVIGADARGFVMPEERSIDINIERDLLLAELMLQRLDPGEAPPPSG